MAKKGFDDAWAECEADIVLEYTAGKPGNKPNYNHHVALSVLVGAVVGGVELLSDRLHRLCGWRFRLRGEVLSDDIMNILRLLVVDEDNRIIDEVAKIHVEPEGRIRLFKVGDPDGYHVGEDEFRDRLAQATIGPSGAIKELVLWRLNRIKEMQQAQEVAAKGHGLAVTMDRTPWQDNIQIIPKTW